MCDGARVVQLQHTSILEHAVTAQQSLSSSLENSMQVNNSPRRARMPEDDVATVRPRLEMYTMIIVLCKRDVAEIVWEKTCEAERESEVKRMLEIELYEEVSEELTSGKCIWNSAWLEPGVARSALADQISGACQRDDVFAGKHKSMRNQETTRKLLKTMHGLQVVSLRWQRLGRGTLCEDRWTMPCVGYNETEHSLVVFHGATTTRLSTIAGALMCGDHWLEEWSVTRKVRALSSGESESHREEPRAVREPLMRYICSKDREQTKTLVDHYDSVASCMKQRLGARKHGNIEVKWLWLRQAMNEIELWNDVMWILMNLMGMKLVAGTECHVQQPRDKITVTMIPDSDVDHEKKNCQRSFESLEMKATAHQLWSGLRAMNS